MQNFLGFFEILSTREMIVCLIKFLLLKVHESYGINLISPNLCVINSVRVTILF